MKIELNNVSKEFEQGKNKIQILKNINLKIESGEVVALLGKSGSGKSTLLSLLAGLENPTSGEVKIDSILLNNLSEDELATWRSQKIGIIFQQFNLINHLTAFENVSIPLEISGIDQVEDSREWLRKVGLEDRSEHYPTMLSGGEQQRVAIARAMVSNPDLILADEPSGNLDSETGKTVMETLFRIIRENKKTMILVTHDEELAKKTDRIIYLKSGECTI
jgi:putative ABC transport system ATP-binding protein